MFDESFGVLITGRVWVACRMSHAQRIPEGFHASIHSGRFGVALAGDRKTVGLRNLIEEEGGENVELSVRGRWYRVAGLRW